MATTLLPRSQRQRGDTSTGEHWLTISDLMAGLMMVFLFIAVALMLIAFEERDRIKEVAIAYQDNQVAIYDALMEEFSEDLTTWQATIDKETLAFEFQAPEVIFASGKADLTETYKSILANFFPRYLAILNRYKSSINEVRIEGHTSSDWAGAQYAIDAYFYNMGLSQARTRSVLQYVYLLPETETQRGWVKTKFAAVGFSSSRIKTLDGSPEGKEDSDASRRVTFRVITNADIQIKRILEAAPLGN